jgi:hypothetical protein
LQYPDPSIKEIEVKLPKLENVQEGNLVNIPIKVINMGESIGSLQYGVFYDSSLLAFSSILLSEKAASWLSYTNPSQQVVEWGGYDASNNQKLIEENLDLATLQFIAKKPKNEWGKSPLYVVNKSAGDKNSKDLNMMPTDGVVQIMRVVNNSPKDFQDVICYPNPTTGITNLEFERKNVGFTEVVVMDAFGREVRTILSEIMPLGKFRYSVDLTGLSEGFYYLIISGEKENQATKVVKFQ